MESDAYVINAFVLEGGRIPEKAGGAPRGHDVFTAAIVSSEFDPHLPYQRARLWDFKSKPHALIEKNIRMGSERSRTEYVYVLRPGEKVTIGMGVVFGMTAHWCAWIARRSSTARKELDAKMHPQSLGSCILPEMLDILDLNIEVPIDPDFRGEPIAILKNIGDEDFPIAHGQRITQLCFMGPDNNWWPIFEQVKSHAELGATSRGNGNQGSSGLYEMNGRADSHGGFAQIGT